MYRDARIHPSNTGVLSTHMKFQSSRLRRTRSEARVSRVLFASLTNSSAIRSEDEHSEQGYQSYGKTNASRVTHGMSGRTSAASRATFMTAVAATNQTILVVGGGLSGMAAALEAAECGKDVVLVEKNPSLGGRVSQLYKYFPKLCHPTCGLEINLRRIKANKRVRVLTLAEVSAITGKPGDYTATIKISPRYVNENCTACGECATAVSAEIPNPFNYNMDKIKAAYLPFSMAYPQRYVIDPSIIGTPDAEKAKSACKYDAVDLGMKEETVKLKVGAVVWATGWKPYDANKIQPYGYDRYAKIG